MDTTITDESLRIIRKAMFQVRQDVGVPETVAAAGSDTSVLWSKCKLCYDVAFNEVLDAHNWTWKRGVSGSGSVLDRPDSWPEDAKNALVYTLARELSIPVAGRVEDLKVFASLADAKLTRARITNLTQELSSNTDPVLARLVANFKVDDAGLVNAFTVYTARATAVKAKCDAEVKATLGLTTLDELATECSSTLAVARLCRVCGMEANDEQLLLQEYQAKIQQWRKVKLDAALKDDTDPVLARLVANFKVDDAGLVNAFTVYTARATAVKESGETEINNAHGWRVKFDYDAADAKSHCAYPAWIALCVSRIAAACGLDTNTCGLFEQEAANILKSATIKDLSDAAEAVSDKDEKEILSLVMRSFSASDAVIPHSFSEITRRIAATKEGARAEVISAHNWSFCREEQSVESCSCDQVDPNYPFSTSHPPRCVRVLACNDAAGRPADWKIVGGYIRSVGPISHILYIRNEERLEKWPPLCRSAYVALIASDIAATVAGSSSESSRLRQAYERDLETAILADSRGTGSDRESKGRNFYADAMLRGRRPSFGGGVAWN